MEKLYSPPKLLTFYKEWLAWAEAGAPEHEHFYPHAGLCPSIYGMFGREECGALGDQLEKVTGTRHFPFGGFEVYSGEEEASSSHKNQERLAWVRARISDMEDK